MKTCPYCGQEYPDDAVVCSADQNALVPSEPARPYHPTMAKSVTIRRFTVVTLFKIVALGCSIFFMGFSLLMGVLALLGAHTVHWNRQPVTGVSGLILSPLLGIVLTVSFTLFGWVGFALSFWIYSKFGRLQVDYISDEIPPSPGPPPIAAGPGASTVA